MTCFIRKTNTPTTTILHINTLHLSIILSQKHIKGLSIHAVQLGKRKYRFLHTIYYNSVNKQLHEYLFWEAGLYNSYCKSALVFIAKRQFHTNEWDKIGVLYFISYQIKQNLSSIASDSFSFSAKKNVRKMNIFIMLYQFNLFYNLVFMWNKNNKHW